MGENLALVLEDGETDAAHSWLSPLGCIACCFHARLAHLDISLGLQTKLVSDRAAHLLHLSPSHRIAWLSVLQGRGGERKGARQHYGARRAATVETPPSTSTSECGSPAKSGWSTAGRADGTALSEHACHSSPHTAAAFRRCGWRATAPSRWRSRGRRGPIEETGPSLQLKCSTGRN